MSEFSLILVLQKENKQNSNMTWQKYKLNLRNLKSATIIQYTIKGRFMSR